MTQTATNSRALIPEANLDFDAIVIGAGVAGLYQLYRLRNLGMRVQLFEAGTGYLLYTSPSPRDS